MMRFFSQIMRFPLTAFVYTMEAFVKAMREIQRSTDQTFDAMVESATQALVNVPGSEDGLSDAIVADGAGGDGASTTNESTHKEEMEMQDQDLSGENTLKLVRYKIIFVKRDLEYAFPEKEEIVAYDTNGADWAGMKVAEFMGGLPGVEQPAKWRERCYPSTDRKIGTIPEADRRYVKVYFEVLQRWQKPEQDQVQVLREIRNEIGGLRQGLVGKPEC